MSADVRREPLFTFANARKAVQNPAEAVRHVRQRLATRFQRLRYDDYREFYLETTKSGVDEDPAAAVGPAELWDEMRRWQHEFLVDETGLDQEDYLLDLGCGVLRGGIPLIDYLESGHYTGMDISADALAKGREFVIEHGLEAKDPTLIQNDDLRFREPALDGVEADIVWAQSVLTHLPPEDVRELLANVNRVLAPGGRFYATIYESDERIIERRNGTGFEYPLATLRKWAHEHDLRAQPVACDHPNDLDMVVFEAREAALADKSFKMEGEASSMSASGQEVTR